MSIQSPTDEIRAIRQALAAKLDNDIKRIGDDIRKRQAMSGRTYIRLPKRAPRAENESHRAAKRR